MKSILNRLETFTPEHRSNNITLAFTIIMRFETLIALAFVAIASALPTPNGKYLQNPAFLP